MDDEQRAYFQILDEYHDTHRDVVRPRHEAAIAKLVDLEGARQAARTLAALFPDLDTPSAQYLDKVAKRVKADSDKG